MTADRVEFLRSNIAALEQMLNELPPEHLVERKGTTAQIQKLKEELAALEPVAARLADAAVTFSGPDVVGSQGMTVTLAGRVLERLQKLVTALWGKREDSSGNPIPPPELLVVGTAPGSFGFEIRERSLSLLPDVGVSSVLAQAQFLLAAAADSDQAFDDTIEDRDRHVATAVRDFLEVLDEHGAAVRLKTKAEVHLDREQVRAAVYRAAVTSVEEDEKRIPGILFLLPGSRRFELRDQAGQTIVAGRLAEQVRIDKLVPLVNTMVKARILTTTTVHPGRKVTRHVLRGVV